MDMYKEGILDITEMILQSILCPPDQREAMKSLAKDRIKNHYLFAFESVCRFSEVWGPWVSGTRERQRLGDKAYCSTGFHFHEPAVQLLPHRTLCKTAWEGALYVPANLASRIQQTHGHNQHLSCGRLSHPREGPGSYRTQWASLPETHTENNRWGIHSVKLHREAWKKLPVRRIWQGFKDRG